MRVDLRLQRFKLGTLFFQADHVFRPDMLADAVRHLIQLRLQQADFIHTVAEPHLPLLHHSEALNRARQTDYRRSQPPGQSDCEQDRHNDRHGTDNQTKVHGRQRTLVNEAVRDHRNQLQTHRVNGIVEHIIMIAAKIPLRLTGAGDTVKYSCSRSTAPRLVQHLAVSSGDKYRMLVSPPQQVQCLVEHAPADLQ
ncbi:hypothetical protein D3C75_471480 [compost metagenome]